MLLDICLVFKIQTAFQSEVKFCLRERHKSIPTLCDMVRTMKHISYPDHIRTEICFLEASCRRTTGNINVHLHHYDTALTCYEAPAILSLTKRIPSGKEHRPLSHERACKVIQVHRGATQCRYWPHIVPSTKTKSPFSDLNAPHHDP